MTIRTLGIVGAGTMGAGIAINAVVSGLSVVLVDRSAEVLAKAGAKLDKFLARQVEKGRMSPDAVAGLRAQLSTAAEMSALAGCDMVIEAVFENLDLKKTIFAELERHVSATCVLATNTSCLRLADIAQAITTPHRFCGLHYFSPAEINPVVEIIQGPQTDVAVLDTALGFLKATGKDPIACKDQNGFALNRFFCPYTNEAALMLDEGLATTGQLDAVARAALGLAMGPFAVMNIIGTATNLNAVRNLGALGPFYQPADSLTRYGTGNTPWEIEAEPAPLDPAREQQIAARLINAVLLPVTEELAEGTASLAAIDRGAEKAFRFGRTPGALLAEIGSDVGSRLRAFAQERGHPVEKLS